MNKYLSVKIFQVYSSIATASCFIVNYIVFWHTGAGIYLHHGGGQVIPNNSLITTTNPSGRIPRFRCLSGSSTSNVGKLIDPNGKDITKSRSDPFVASNYERGSLVVSNVRPLVAADVGIYTCRIPDENGVSVDVNFGLYLSSISSKNYVTGGGGGGGGLIGGFFIVFFTQVVLL